MVPAGSFVDDRGTLLFSNDFDLSCVKRFYIVRNHSTEVVRAWHGHMRERKFVMAASGVAIVACVPIATLKEYKAGDPVPGSMYRFVLSDRDPAILNVPPGYANGFRILTDGGCLLFMSTSAIDESRRDDIRFPADRFATVFDIANR